MRNDAFAEYHPTVNFTFFAFVLFFSMVLRHPAAQLISLFTAVLYAFQCGGKSALKPTVFAGLPLIFFTAIINPAFNHAGVTVLSFLPNGNPLTLESVMYGLSSGVMLCTVLVWFYNFNRVMTSDKFVYLFGKIIPALSLVLSMALRFIPRFIKQFSVVRDAQKCIGRDTDSGNILRRFKNTVAVFSVMVTWSLENSIETADSMKSRGYGLRERTAFSIYKFEPRDKTALFLILFCGIAVLSVFVSRGLAFQYFPSIRCVPATPVTVGAQIIYFVLCIIPFANNEREAKKWTALHSKI